MGVGRFPQAIKLDHRLTHRSRLNEFGDPLYGLPRAPNRRPKRGHIAAVRLWRFHAGRDKSGAAAGLEHSKGLLCHLFTDRVEHDIAAAYNFRKILRVIVYYFVRSESLDIITVRRACRRDHASTEVFGELNGEACDPARAALNQDGLAAFELQRVGKSVDSREAGQRHGGGFDMRDGSRLLGDNGGFDGDLFGIGPFLARLKNAEDRIAD